MKLKAPSSWYSAPFLIEGIPTYKSYARMPGYDLVATNPEKARSARIQVKSRWASDFDGGFLVNNFDCDFVVFVALNRGYRYAKARMGVLLGEGKKAPEYYVFPTSIVQNALYEKSSWGKVFIKSIEDSDKYKENWNLVREFLNNTTPPSPPITLPII